MELYSKYHHLIEQTTRTGLFEYEYASQTMVWSDYVYTIFNYDTNYQPITESHIIYCWFKLKKDNDK